MARILTDEAAATLIPRGLGKAHPGLNPRYAREDHVHPARRGVVEIDFGPFPGSGEASVAVDNQVEIQGDSQAFAMVAAEDCGSTTAQDAAFLASLMGLSCTPPTPGIGFTILARSTEALQGKLKVRWTWA